MTEDKMKRLVDGEVVEDASNIYRKYTENPDLFWLSIAEEYEARGNYEVAQEIRDGIKKGD